MTANLEEPPGDTLRRYAGILVGLDKLHSPVGQIHGIGGSCKECTQAWPCRTALIMHPEWAPLKNIPITAEEIAGDREMAATIAAIVRTHGLGQYQLKCTAFVEAAEPTGFSFLYSWRWERGSDVLKGGSQ